MPNAVLQSLEGERAEVLATMDAVLAEVDGRDLVDAERSLLERSRDRIGQIDAQIEPLREIEALRGAHTATTTALTPTVVDDQPRRAAGDDRAPMYPSAGAFLVDYVRAIDRNNPDHEAMRRVAAAQTRAVANQITSDTPGILPVPIVGDVVNLIDAQRPLISSVGGARALGAIPGTTFNRPKITQHTQVGKQATEKTELASRKMTIGNVPFTKETYGGTVDISRQDIDWTSPSAWDILVRDLADVYAISTETVVATDFKAKATGTAVSIGTAGQPITLAAWATGLYTAAMHSYQAGQRMPDRIWCSLDVWAALGALVDTSRVVLPVDTTREMGAPGTSNLGAFAGDLFGLPRIVVPTFPSGTCIVGPSTLYEVYEDVIGLLSVVEPSILGVQVAYGGYLAYGNLAGPAFVPLTIVGTLPTLAELDAGDDAEAEPANGGKATK